jgi:hypothetical protein
LVKNPFSLKGSSSTLEVMKPSPFVTLLKILAGLFAVSLVIGVVAFAWLQSESGSRWILGKVKASAEAQPGITFNFETGKIEPFSRIFLKGLKVGVKRDGMDVNVDLPEFEAKYSFSILGRSLLLEKLSMTGFKLTGTMELPETSEPAQPEAQKPTDWPSLQEMLDHPSATAELQSIRLEKASIDLAFSKKGAAPMEGRIVFPEADAEFKGKLVAGRAEGSSSFKLASPENLIRVKMSAAKTEDAPAYTDEISFSPSAEFAGGFELATPQDANSGWRFDLKGDKSSFKLARFVMDRAFGDAKLAPWKVRFNEQAIEAKVHATPARVSLILDHKGSPILVRMDKEFPAIQPDFSAQFGTSPDLKAFDFESELSLNQVKLLKAKGKGGLHSGDANLELSGIFHTDSRLAALVPALKSYPEMNIGFEGEFSLPAAKSGETRTMDIKKLSSTFQGQEYFVGKMTATLGSTRADANGSMRFKLPASLFTFLKKAGLWKAQEKPILAQAEKALIPTALDTDFKAVQSVGEQQTEMTWEGTSRFSGLGVISDTEFSDPMSFTHSFKQVKPKVGAKEMSGTFGALIPQLVWKKEVDARETRADLAFSMTGEAHPVMKMSWNASQKNLTVRDPASHAPIPLQGVKSSGEFTINEQGTMIGKNMLFSIHQDLFKVQMDITGNERTGKAEIVGKASMKVPKKFPVIAGNRLSGGMEMPWTVQVRGGKEILVNGAMQFQDMAWSNGKYGFSGLSGKVSLIEALERRGNSVTFARIENPNAFERVDFERIQPYLQESEKTQILEITYEDRKIGPFFGYFSIYQNLMSVNQFNMKLGKDGRAYGEFFIDANPAQLRMGFLSRLTELDLGEILPSRLLKNTTEGSKKISGRGGMVINLTKSTVEGRMDVTEIGGSQLITMMRALDPKGKDEKINRACSALGLAYPTFVGMSFNSGLMDMNIDMSLPAPSMNLRGIPIAGSVASSFAPMKAMLEKSGYTQAANATP